MGLVKEYKYQGASARVTTVDAETAFVSHVWSNIRKHGFASEMMENIARDADKRGQTLLLVSRPYDTPQRDALAAGDLVKFYERFDFVLVDHADGGHLMRRLPRTKNTA